MIDESEPSPSLWARLRQRVRIPCKPREVPLARWLTAPLLRNAAGACTAVALGLSPLVVTLAIAEVNIFAHTVVLTLLHFLHFAPNPIPTILLDLAVALAGIIDAFVSPILHPLRTGLIVGAGLAISNMSFLIDPLMVSLHPNRRAMTHIEEARVLPIARRVAKKMGIETLPRFVAEESPLPGAYATPSMVILTTGLGLESNGAVDSEQLAAIIAHEFHHIRRGDTIAARFINLMAAPLLIPVLACRILQRHDPDGDLRLPLIMTLLLTPTRVLITVIAAARTFHGRRQEFAADRAAAEIGLGSSILRAITTIDRYYIEHTSPQARFVFEPVPTGLERALTRTHPFPAERRAALQKLIAGGQAEQTEGRLRVSLRTVAHAILSITVCASLVVGMVTLVRAQHAPAFYPGAQYHGTVPTGYQHTRTGAVAAATNYHLVTIRDAVELGDGEISNDILDMAAATYRSQFVEDLRHGYQFVRGAVEEYGRISLDDRPIAYSVQHFSPEEATVAIWSEVHTTQGDSKQPAYYSIDIYHLAWSAGDWRLTTFGDGADALAPSHYAGGVPPHYIKYVPAAPHAQFSDSR